MSQTHETRTGHGKVKGSSERSFGVVFTVVFLIIALFPLVGNWTAWDQVRLWSVAIAAVLLAISFFAPSVLAPANRAWLWFGLLLNKIVSPLVLGVMFFIVLTPISLFRRMFSKTSIAMRGDDSVDSYWTMRSDDDAETSMKNQF